MAWDVFVTSASVAIICFIQPTLRCISGLHINLFSLFLVLILSFQLIHLLPYFYVSFEKEDPYFKVGLFLFLVSLRLGFFCLVFKKTVYYTEGFFVCIVLKHALLVEIFCYHMAIMIDE